MGRRQRGREVDGILLLDKPLGMSSNAALQSAKRLFNAAKAGHTGNLDPLASGMLPICFGQATKLSGMLLDSDKAYLADVRLGQATTTGDAEGEVIEQSDPEALSEGELRSALERFVGEIEQVPPMYSALKHEGKRLYQLAREGQTVERRPRRVHIHALQLLGYEPGRALLEVRCSKGTYIRTLAEDVARAVGQVAHLGGLRRSTVSPFEGKPMWTLDALQAEAEDGTDALDRLLLPLAAAVPGWAPLSLPEESLRRLARGQALPMPLPPAVRGCPLALTDAQGQLMAAGGLDDRGRLISRRWLSSRNFA